MRILMIASLILVVVPTSLYAQGMGTSSSSSGTSSTSSFSDSTPGVENQAQTATFVGGGKPDAFVGTVDIYASFFGASRTARSTSRASAARATTTSRPRTSATTSRVAGTTMGLTSQAGGVNSQTVRALTSFDDGFTFSTERAAQPTIESYFARIQGVQDMQLSFTNSLQGATAVVSGAVPTVRERRVVQQMLLLEPGIDRVDNRLEIRSPGYPDIPWGINLKKRAYIPEGGSAIMYCTMP